MIGAEKELPYQRHRPPRCAKRSKSLSASPHGAERQRLVTAQAECVKLGQFLMLLFGTLKKAGSFLNFGFRAVAFGWFFDSWPAAEGPREAL
jgi:hypothetical protein